MKSEILSLGWLIIREFLCRKAKKDIDMAFELEPNSPDCYLTRASLYLAMKKKRLARQDGQTAISLGASPEHVAPLLERCN